MRHFIALVGIVRLLRILSQMVSFCGPLPAYEFQQFQLRQRGSRLPFEWHITGAPSVYRTSLPYALIRLGKRCR